MKADFLKYQAQTTPHPLAMQVSHAKGSYIYDTSGKAHLFVGEDNSSKHALFVKKNMTQRY